MSSMIYDTDTTIVLSRQRYSPKAQAFFEANLGSEDKFRNSTLSGNNGR